MATYYLTNPNSWYPVPKRAMILLTIPAIQLLTPVPMAPQSLQKMRDWALTTMTKAGTSLSYLYQSWSASNALTSRSSKKTVGNKTKRKMEYLTTIPRVMMVTFHLWNERLIFTSEEVPASEEVFASTAELCSFNFSLFPLLWNHGIAVTFYVLCTY